MFYRKGFAVKEKKHKIFEMSVTKCCTEFESNSL